MRPRNLLILFLVVAGLGAFIAFFERDLPGSDERRKLAKKAVGLERKDVLGLEIERGPSKATFELAEKGDGEGAAPRSWRLVEPLAARADTSAVDSLIDGLLGLEKQSESKEVDLAAAGLATPWARVRLRAKNEAITLLVGNELPLGNQRFAAREGQSGAFVVADTALSALEKEPRAWRATDLLPGSRMEMSRVALGEGESQVRLVKKEGGTFWVEASGLETDRADRDAAHELLDALAELKAARFLDEPGPEPASLGLTPPQLVVEATFDKGEPFKLELGDPVPDAPDRRYGRADGQLFELSTELPTLAARPAGEWRSRAWTTFETFDVAKLELRGGAGPFKLEKDGTDWKRGKDKIDYGVVSDLLYALKESQAAAFLTTAEAPTTTELELLLENADGTVKETLAFAGEVGGSTVARSSLRPVAFLLPAERVAEVKAAIEAVRTAEPVVEGEAAAEAEADAEEPAKPE